MVIGWCHLAGVRYFYYHLIFVTFHHDFNACISIIQFDIHFIASKLSLRINFPRNPSDLSICTRKCDFRCNCNFRNTCQMIAHETYSIKLKKWDNLHHVHRASHRLAISCILNRLKLQAFCSKKKTTNKEMKCNFFTENLTFFHCQRL